MSQLDEQRRKRAASGSRRRRDLNAAGIRQESKAAREETERREREDRLRPKVAASPKADAAWEAAAAALKDCLPDSRFSLWLGPIACLGEVDGALALEAPEGIFAWTNRRYGKLIGETVRGATDYRGAFLFQQARTVSEGIL